MIVLRKLRIHPAKGMTEESWLNKARGAKDEYGNPFRIITLRWNHSRTNLCTNYQKTHGFEDAIIAKDGSTGGFKITYRPGTLMWMRPLGGIGDFEAMCPMTPRNMKALIAAYPNRKWRIVDEDVNAKVKRGWDERWDRMDERTKEFNDKWFKAMHTLASERNDPVAIERADLSIEKKEVEEEKRIIEIKKQEIEKEKEKANEVLKEVNQKVSTLETHGIEAVTYSRDYLNGVKSVFSLRKIAREMKIPISPNEKKKAVIEKIIAKQSGKLDSPEPKGLGD